MKQLRVASTLRTKVNNVVYYRSRSSTKDAIHQESRNLSGEPDQLGSAEESEAENSSETEDSMLSGAIATKRRWREAPGSRYGDKYEACSAHEFLSRVIVHNFRRNNVACEVVKSETDSKERSSILVMPTRDKLTGQSVLRHSRSLREFGGANLRHPFEIVVRRLHRP